MPFLYGICAGPSGKYERIAGPSLDSLGLEPRIVKRGEVSIHHAYNSILDDAAEFDDVEGIVLLHDDLEILSDDVESRLRETFSDSTIGIAGLIGGRDHRAMHWWERPDTMRGHVTDNQNGLLDHGRETYSVDSVDGMFIALSPAAVAVLRFDEIRFGRTFHGYDADICAAARAAGLKVVVVDIDAHHHNNATSIYGDQLTYRITDQT